MPVAWVLFDVCGTLVDPAVLAQPLGDSAAADEVVQAAVDDVAAQAMVATLTGDRAELPELLEAALARRLALAGAEPDGARDAVALLSSLPAYLEAPAALERLRGEGLRLAALAQGPAQAAEEMLRFAGLRDRLELVLGTDGVDAFKPAAATYRAALDHTGATAAETCLVSAHWWDVAGARRAGLRTGWVARRERLLLSSVPVPDVSGPDLEAVAGGVLERLR